MIEALITGVAIVFIHVSVFYVLCNPRGGRHDKH